MTGQAEPTSREQLLVDQLIDHGLADSPATDWSLTLPPDWLDGLPIEDDRLWRPNDAGELGSLQCPVYRDRELVVMELTKPLLILSDSSGYRDTLYMNTDTGQIGHDLTEIGLLPPEQPPRVAEPHTPTA